jgi:hypothetical protein
MICHTSYEFLDQVPCSYTITEVMISGQVHIHPDLRILRSLLSLLAGKDNLKQ